MALYKYVYDYDYASMIYYMLWTFWFVCLSVRQIANVDLF